MREVHCENVLGYPVATACKGACIRQILQWLESGEKGKTLVCVNPHSLEMARTDAEFEKAIQNADLIVPDGCGIVIASKILGGRIRKRVTGSDVFWGLCSALNEMRNFRCFFLGSTEQTLSKIVDKMKTDFPHITVAGTYSPPFKTEFSDEDNCLMLASVNRAEADVLWVGMTAPKQEKWIFQNRDRIDVKFIGAIGAVFDFYVGNVKRSHPVFQKLGLEWLPRLIQEPRRLWRRNFISHPKFMLAVLIHRFKYGKSSSSKPDGSQGLGG